MDAIVPRPGNNPPECGGQAPAQGNGGNGHRRRRRRQVLHGHRRAALRADTAVMLVESGMSVGEAIERCATDTRYFYALKALRESGNTALHRAVLKGNDSVDTSAKRVENAAAAIVALRKCTASERKLVWLSTGMTTDAVALLLSMSPDQLVATAKAIGTDWLWTHLIEPAMSASEAPAKVVSGSVDVSNIT